MSEEKFNTSPEETQDRVSKVMKNKTKKAIEKKNNVLKTLKVEYVRVDELQPNDYNPNRQSDHDFELLLMSMKEDGFTQPIVALRDTKIIVDGEHRWRAASTLGYQEVPVVFTDMTPEQMRIATLRHNRARGSEDVSLTADVLRDLQALGAIEWAQDSLMMDDVELNRMLEEISAAEDLAGDEYEEAWVPDDITDDDAIMASSNHSTQSVDISRNMADGSTHESAMSEQAAQDIRVRERQLKDAKSEEERQMALQANKLYRLSLVFSGDESDIVKSVLGSTPAENIVRLCKEELERK